MWSKYCQNAAGRELAVGVVSGSVQLGARCLENWNWNWCRGLLVTSMTGVLPPNNGVCECGCFASTQCGVCWVPAGLQGCNLHAGQHP